MFGKLKTGYEDIHISFDGNKIPARIHTEPRNNIRFSMGKTRAICRLPVMLPTEERTRQLRRFEDWVRQVFEQKKDLRARFFKAEYKTGDTLQVGAHRYRITVTPSDKKTHYARLSGDEIILDLCADTPEGRKKAARHLISRIVARHQLPRITRRVDDWNDRYFKKDLNGVRLKYNRSNWGSCSSRGNVNLSTRLLFAPEWVQDYVIVHELAHLVEMNHSPRFWKIVADILPDYKEAEKWLKTNGGKCDF